MPIWTQKCWSLLLSMALSSGIQFMLILLFSLYCSGILLLFMFHSPHIYTCRNQSINLTILILHTLIGRTVVIKRKASKRAFRHHAEGYFETQDKDHLVFNYKIQFAYTVYWWLVPLYCVLWAHKRPICLTRLIRIILGNFRSCKKGI